MWMAPNMVTLLGFMWIVANVFIIEIFVPDMVGPVSICFWLGWK
jgi:ethanolaminephosphotransferase